MEKEVKKYEKKKMISIFLSNELVKLIEKRARKNMLSVPEQIEDILRRSTISQGKKKSAYYAKVDDKLVGLFSRHKTGPKKRKKGKRIK